MANRISVYQQKKPFFFFEIQDVLSFFFLFFFLQEGEEGNNIGDALCFVSRNTQSIGKSDFFQYRDRRPFFSALGGRSSKNRLSRDTFSLIVLKMAH